MRIYNYTTINPAMTKETDPSDLPFLFNGKGTPSENIIEYAGRVCYKSTDKMGHNPTFNAQRMKEGHSDVFEHVYVTIEVDKWDSLILQFDRVRQTWLDVRRFFSICDYMNKWYITANLRAWYGFAWEVCNLSPETKLVSLLQQVSPQLFGEPKEAIWTVPELPIPFSLATYPQVVTLIGITVPVISPLPERHSLNINAATFLIEGVSRSLTHQLVRHRLLSFSQESQRYVSLKKGEWGLIKPPAFYMTEDEQQWDALSEHVRQSYTYYKERYKQEDARFVLPNAIETRLVVSGPLAVWDQVLFQRTSSAAQWEIRGVITKIATLLVHTGLDYFKKYT